MLILIVRSVILYFVVVISMRLMGKRQIGQLEPSELAAAILMSEFAANSLDDPGKPLITSIAPIIVLLALEFLLAFLFLKCHFIKKLFCGSDCIVIKDGRILESQLKRLRVTIDELFEELRQKNIDNIDDVKYAIYESGGQLSVFPRTLLTPAVKSDINPQTREKGIHFIIVADGKVNPSGLAETGKTEKWLDDILRQNNISALQEVYYMSANVEGEVLLHRRAEK